MPEDQGMLDTLGNAVRLARPATDDNPGAVSARRQRPTNPGCEDAPIPRRGGQPPNRNGLHADFRRFGRVRRPRRPRRGCRDFTGARDPEAPPADRQPQRPAVGHPRERQAAPGRRRIRPQCAHRGRHGLRAVARRAASAASSGRCTSRARPMPGRAASRASSSSRSTSRCASSSAIRRTSRSRSVPTTSNARTRKAASLPCSAWRAATRSRTRSARCATSTGSACAT